MKPPPIDESPMAFMRRVWDVILRIAALLLIGALHWGLEKCIGFVIPEGWEAAENLLQQVSFVFFALIYVYLLWDMLKVFLPILQARPYPVDENGKKKKK